MAILNKLKEYAKSHKKHIVLPEGQDLRTVETAAILLEEQFADVTILGNVDEITDNFSKFGASDIPEIIDPRHDSRFQSFVKAYYEKRQDKGETLESALETMHNPLFFGAMMVEKGYADGCVAGALNTSSDVLRSALRVIGTAEGIKLVSSFMMMETGIEEYGDKGTLFFADVAVNIAPNSDQLANIAIATADSWKKFMDTEPKVAFLSFATKGSAKDPSLDKIKDALKIVKTKRPDIQIDGEMQLDAAIVPSIGASKAPDSDIAGRANVLIFPDLSSANIGYKLVERFSPNASATGPILQGLAKPINDVSRGAKAMDLVNTALVTIYQGDK